MKILHYIPNFKKSMGQAARFVQMLQVVMGKSVETHIISGSISRAEFQKRVDELQPDIIHIHGCWSFKSAIIELWARNRNIPVIISPHDSLSQKELQVDFWKKKLPSLIAYQLLAIKKAMVLHATSSQELDDLKQLGWKKRVAFIPEPDGKENNAQTVESFRTLYQKVIDTANRNKLSDLEEKCLWALLQVAVATRHKDSDNASAQAMTAKHSDSDVLDMLHKLSTHNWKNIQVYAIDHGVKDILLTGVKALSLHLPITVDALPSRFRAKSTIGDGTVSNAEKKILKDFAASKDSCRLAEDFLHLAKMLCKKQYNAGWQPPIRLILSVYERLLYTLYDEAVFCEIIKRLKIKSFCAYIMQTLEEKLRLSIGFMPVDPKNNKKAKKLYKKLNDFNIPIETT